MELENKYLEALEDIKFPKITNRASLQIWKAKAINVVSRIYGKDSKQEEQINLIKIQNNMSITSYVNGHVSTSGGGNNSATCEKQATELIESFISDIKKFGIPEKQNPISKNDQININVSQTQSINLNIILNALQNELTGKQFSEIQQIIDIEEDKEVKQNKIVEKLKSFGKDIATNIIASILTNPAIYG
ncbi:hypothetical protein [Flavobacterium covae]|uniref:hypothetical protein n=1 Tax=Flavobacterium covae TaxID=2906076 RepID=UPI003394AF9B